MTADVLVIGSGIAGLSYSLKLAMKRPGVNIIVLTKTNADETNTKYAQGGVAVVIDEEKDSFEKHIKDTLIAGDGLCNEKIVELVVKEGPARMREIIEWGTDFDKEADGDFKLGKEGGHSEFRILHHKDVTGKEIERALLEKIAHYKNVQILDHYFVIDLITQHHLGHLVTKSTQDIECYGVYVLNQHNHLIEKILSKITLLATGGCGQVYRTTTNPKIATGDGMAMVYRAKGRIENMEFIQFHPTALFEPGKRFGQSFLITEAVRGDGGILRNSKGEEFMHKYDARLSLAPRDIVARAIDSEMKLLGDEHVYLDCRHMDIENFKTHFPTIYEKCLSIGIDIRKDFIPVAPAAHYSCGGVKTNEHGMSSIHQLYCCGEASSSGLHGANRLASNSLLEGLVFAARIADDLKTNLPEQGEPVENNSISILLDPAIRKDIANAMSKGAGVIRTRESLEEVLATLDQLAKKTSDQPCVEAWEVTNLHCLANVLVRSALIREETRGSHWREDFPNTLKSWEQRILQEMDTEGNYLHNLEKVINE